MIGQNTPSTSSSFTEYHQARVRIADLEEEKTRITCESEQAQQVLVLLLLTIPDPLNSSRVQAVAKLIEANTKRLSDIVSTINVQYLLCVQIKRLEKIIKLIL